MLHLVMRDIHFFISRQVHAAAKKERKEAIN